MRGTAGGNLTSRVACSTAPPSARSSQSPARRTTRVWRRRCGRRAAAATAAGPPRPPWLASSQCPRRDASGRAVSRNCSSRSSGGSKMSSADTGTAPAICASLDAACGRTMAMRCTAPVALCKRLHVRRRPRRLAVHERKQVPRPLIVAVRRGALVEDPLAAHHDRLVEVVAAHGRRRERAVERQLDLVDIGAGLKHGERDVLPAQRRLPHRHDAHNGVLAARRPLGGPAARCPRPRARRPARRRGATPTRASAHAHHRRPAAPGSQRTGAASGAASRVV